MRADGWQGPDCEAYVSMLKSLDFILRAKESY